MAFVPAANADVVVAGTLTFSLDGDAFANGADVAYLNEIGQSFNPGFTYNEAQGFLEFARHRQDAPAGRPAPFPTTFNDLRASWVRPSSIGLTYDFNDSPLLQTLAFDPGTVAAAGATGSTRFKGGDAFWFANESMIAPITGVPASVWIQYGNLGLSFDAGRIGGGNSGWYFTQNLAGPLPLYDIRNLAITVVAAGPGTGSLGLSGSLVTSREFRDFLGIQAGLDVGTFEFVGATVVPVPAAAWLFAGALASLALSRRRQA
jgi:hypothetical protein